MSQKVLMLLNPGVFSGKAFRFCWFFHEMSCFVLNRHEELQPRAPYEDVQVVKADSWGPTSGTDRSLGSLRFVLRVSAGSGAELHPRPSPPPQNLTPNMFCSILCSWRSRNELKRWNSRRVRWSWLILLMVSFLLPLKNKIILISLNSCCVRGQKDDSCFLSGSCCYGSGTWFCSSAGLGRIWGFGMSPFSPESVLVAAETRRAAAAAERPTLNAN